MASPASSQDIGRVIDGRYRLVAPLGVGASARVFLAEDTRLGRQVAVKMLQPALAGDAKFLDRFRAEARTVAAFSHPNVVVVHDWGEDDGGSDRVPFLVTEYLDGGSLRAMIQAGHPLTPSQALVIGLDVCRGLAKAHGQGLVHRDLKPANLLFDREGRLRVADFGLARAIAEAAVTEPDGAVIGTARYVAPEQAEGKVLDGKADIYALALCLVESVTGAHPFPADTTMGTLMARTTGDLDVPRELGALAPAVARAGRLDPEERPDAEEFGIALLAASERLPAPKPLPLVGALTEAEQSTGGAQESTKTMTMPAADLGDVSGVGTPPAAASAPVPAAAGASGDGSGGDSSASGADGGPNGPSVADEDTPRRRRWPMVVGIVAVLALIGGVGAYLAMRTPTHEVPNLVGQQVGELELLADEYGWVIDEKPTRQNGTAAGEIVSTTPEAGTDLAEGATLEVLVSAGNELTDVPTELVGRPFDEVQSILEDASLVGVAVEEFHEEVADGVVVGFVDEPEDREPEGAEIEFRVSKGPAPRTVPPLPTGATFGEYREALEAVQLQAQRVEEFSDSVEEGQVISVGTAPGTDVPRDTEVEVVVSKGPEMVEVPDLTGKNVNQARRALEEVGLELGTTNRDSGRVVISDPRAGEEVRVGRSVDLLVRRASGDDD